METCELSDYSVKCTWDGKDKDIKSTISLGNAYEKSEVDSDLSQLVQLETCVLLTNPDSKLKVPCSLQVTFANSSVRVTKIYVASEAHIIELYGQYGEYIKTVRAENIDDFEGLLVNLAEAEVSNVPEITLKFAGLKTDCDKFWLYGIRLFVDIVPVNMNSKVNYQNVEDRLKTAKVPITEKAERCKKFLQQYTNLTNSYVGKQPDAQTVLKLLEEDCMAQLKPFSNASRSMSKCISSLIPTLLNKKERIGSENGLTPEVDVQELKYYIDQSLEKMEARIINHFDNRLKEFEERQNEKLESILLLLKNR